MLSQGFYALLTGALSNVMAVWINFQIHGTVINSDTVP